MAACRAVLFASLVDDPSAHPDKFPTEETQEVERQRLFRIIEELVKWENSSNERVLEDAKAEIAGSLGTIPRVPLRLQTSPATEPFRQPVIAADRVRYAGEPVVVVLADSPALAEDGIDAIVLEIEELPVVADRFISARGETLLFEEAGTNLAMKFTAVKGEADAAFCDAPYKRSARFRV